MRLTAVIIALFGCGRARFDPLPDVDALGDVAVDAPGEPPGILLHFTFDGAGFVTDTSGNHHDATCATCPAQVPGRIGQAAMFSGAECLAIADAADLRPAQFTFALWANFNVTQDSTVAGRPKGGSSVPGTWRVAISGSDVWSVTVNGNGLGVMVGRDRWHHIAGVFDGNNIVRYVDGMFPFFSNASAAIYGNDDIYIGCGSIDPSLSLPFVGLVDDVRLYDRALSSEEVAELAAM